jgi:hypothetical protein
MSLTEKDLSSLVVCVVSGRVPRSRRAEALLEELYARGAVRARLWNCSCVPVGRNRVTADALLKSGVSFTRPVEGGAPQWSPVPPGRLWLWLDDDQWAPLAELLDWLTYWGPRVAADPSRLLVGGVYTSTVEGTGQLCAGTRGQSFWLGAGARDYHPDGVEVDWNGAGCLLHAPELIEQVTRALDLPLACYGEAWGPVIWRTLVAHDTRGVTREHGEDLGFCAGVRVAGGRVVLAPELVLAHEGQGTFWPRHALEPGPDLVRWEP